MLVDGGSSLNIITTEILKRLQISEAELQETGTFQGVNPGKTKPKGQITLPVTFGTSANFRTEKVVFDVVDIPLSYNGIIGRPTLAKFMAASHYAYNTLKMPGPKGIITIRTDKKDAVMCLEKMHKDSVVAPHDNLEILVVSEASGKGSNQSIPGNEDKASGKRREQCASGKDGDPSTSKKQKMAASALTKKVPAKPDGSGAFTIGANLSDK